MTSYGFLSTYPPTQCGLASFTASLAAALRDADPATRIGVVASVEVVDPDPLPEVVHQLVVGDRATEAAAAAALNGFDVAVIQHEFGIYAGRDGERVVGILRRLHVPTIVVLHTVLAAPTAHQRAVLEDVVAAASVVVVMTETARVRLAAGYRTGTTGVALIAHGAPTDWDDPDPDPHRVRSSQLLTWGLLGPGKGIEWAVDALARLQDLDPPARYVVAGETHPHVVEREGEAYRTMLTTRAAAAGVGAAVRFEGRYLDRPSLRDLVVASDVVVLPYDSTDQVTSGVLIEAVIARRPVVATAFPHAVELLSGGAGTVVAHRDPAALAAAIRRILTEPGVADAMVAAAGALAPGLTWAAVAERYRALAANLQPGVASVVA